MVNILSKFLPLLFFLHLVGLWNNLGNDVVYVKIIETVRGISLGIRVDSMTLKFLGLLNFIWIVLIFYSHRFLRLEENADINRLKLFFAVSIALVNLVIIAQNLLTTLFCYNFLILSGHFFAVKFLHKKETRFSTIFTFLLYLESFFFFLATVATYKYAGRIDFMANGILPDNISQAKVFTLLILYFAGLFFSTVLLPSCLINRDISFNPMIIYGLFFLSYAFSSLYILVKIVVFVFGLDVFTGAMSKMVLSCFEIIFLLNLVASAVLMLLSKNLKSAFFYLFFNQFIFALFSIFTFAIFDKSKIYLPLFSFLLSITLIFFCLSNLILFLEKSVDKNLKGLFYDLKITAFLLAFACLNLIGFAPSIGALEKLFLIKIWLKEKSLLAAIIFIINSATMILFTCRLFYQMLSKDQIQRSEADLHLAKDIDFDSGLILTTLTTAIVVFSAVVLTNFFSL